MLVSERAVSWGMKLLCRIMALGILRSLSTVAVYACTTFVYKCCEKLWRHGWHWDITAKTCHVEAGISVLVNFHHETQLSVYSKITAVRHNQIRSALRSGLHADLGQMSLLWMKVMNMKLKKVERKTPKQNLTATLKRSRWSLCVKPKKWDWLSLARSDHSITDQQFLWHSVSIT